MYNRIKAEDPTFLIVESMEGEVFGGFATSAWASGCQVCLCVCVRICVVCVSVFVCRLSTTPNAPSRIGS